jgi:ketosteroid isomerase-like protein
MIAVAQEVKVEELCRSYLTAMESGDLEALLSLFTDDAIATSPISGKQPVRDFYSYVMRITSARSMVLKTVFIGSSDPTRAAIHIAYTRTVGKGKPATIEGVDVFELTGDLSQFTSVTIIYDTAPVRSDFDR